MQKLLLCFSPVLPFALPCSDFVTPSAGRSKQGKRKSATMPPKAAKGKEPVAERPILGRFSSHLKIGIVCTLLRSPIVRKNILSIHQALYTRALFVSPSVSLHPRILGEARVLPVAESHLFKGFIIMCTRLAVIGISFLFERASNLLYEEKVVFVTIMSDLTIVCAVMLLDFSTFCCEPYTCAVAETIVVEFVVEWSCRRLFPQNSCLCKHR